MPSEDSCQQLAAHQTVLLIQRGTKYIYTGLSVFVVFLPLPFALTKPNVLSLACAGHGRTPLHGS